MIAVRIELEQSIDVSRDGKIWEAVEIDNADVTEVLEIVWLILHHRVMRHDNFHARSGLYYRWK